MTVINYTYKQEGVLTEFSSFFGECFEKSDTASKFCIDYYPFGLQHSTSWTRSTSLKNKNLYNAGSELNEKTGYYETLLRNYDPALGRFTGVDALAGLTPRMNPYHFGGNNPVMYNDPTGAYSQGWQDVSRFLSQVPGVNPFDEPFENSNWVDEFRSDWGNSMLSPGVTPTLGYVENGLSNSEFGGTWTPGGGFSYFSSKTEAFNAGLAYNEYHNSWASTTYGAPTGGKRRLGQRTDDHLFFEIDENGKLFIPYTNISFWDNYEANQATQNSSGWLEQIWNSTIARAYIPDYVHIGFGVSGIVGAGPSTSIELNWVLRGKQASIKPIVTSTVTAGGGYQIDYTLNIGGSRYLGSVSEIRRDFLNTSIGDGQAGIYISGGASALGKIGVTGTWTPTATGYGLLQTEANIGVGLTPGVNGSGGVSNTFILYDFY